MRFRCDRGFTLLEVLMVVVIIGILAVLIVPAVIQRGDDARIMAARADMRTLSNALELYRLDNSIYPSTAQGLAALVQKPSGQPEPRAWREPYIKSLPNDPWGTPYRYELIRQSSTYDIVSYGADGVQGGTDLAADIRLTELTATARSE